MDGITNTRIIFTNKADLVLSDIFKKYGLNESDEKVLKNAQEKKPFNITILVRLTREFAGESISEKDLIVSLQKNLSGVLRFFVCYCFLALKNQV